MLPSMWALVNSKGNLHSKSTIRQRNNLILGFGEIWRN